MEWKELISENFAVIGTLLGVVFGFFGNVLNEKFKFSREFKAEELKRNREEYEELITIYEEILKNNGEFDITYMEENGMDSFNPGLYNKRVRSLLFQKYSFHNEKVMEIITSIDNQLIDLKMPNLIPPDIWDVLTSCNYQYNNLIVEIKTIVDIYRDEKRML